MTYSEQLEREAEHTRLQLAGTLDELRASLSPGHVVDHLVSYTNDGAGKEFLHNLKRQTVTNPLPVALIGAGVAWLLLSSTSSKRGSAESSTTMNERADDVGGAYDSVKHAASETASGLSEAKDRAKSTMSGLGEAAASGVDRLLRAATTGGDRARDAASSAGATLGDAVSSTRDAAASGYDAATRATASMTASATKAGHSAVSASRSLAEFASEQPLVLAGLGLALGAALGAMLPATDTENELMGEASDELKGRAQQVAAETYDKAAAVGERAVEAAKEEAEHQGMTAERDAGSGSTASEGDQSQGTPPDGQDSQRLALDNTSPSESKPEPTSTGSHESAGTEGSPRREKDSAI